MTSIAELSQIEVFLAFQVGEHLDEVINVNVVISLFTVLLKLFD